MILFKFHAKTVPLSYNMILSYNHAKIILQALDMILIMKQPMIIIQSHSMILFEYHGRHAWSFFSPMVLIYTLYNACQNCSSVVYTVPCQDHYSFLCMT
jgi:hypothetical protein